MTGEKYVQTSLSLQDSYTYSQTNNIPSHCRGWQGANGKVKLERPDYTGGDVLTARHVEQAARRSWAGGIAVLASLRSSPYLSLIFWSKIFL